MGAESESEGDEVGEVLSSVPARELLPEEGLDEGVFKEAYSECFVAAFLADLDQVRDNDGNSTMVACSLNATAVSFSPSQRKHFTK